MDHRTPCSLIFIPDWDADVVPVSICCCSGIPHEVCTEGTPEEVVPQICSDEEIVVPRKRSRNQRTIPIWRPSSSRPTADVSSQPEPEQSDQQGTSKTIQEITDEYVASQAAIPTNKTKDISRMERSIVQSFDRRVMDPEVDTYLGDQRYWKNRKKDRAPPKQCNRALAKTSRDEVNKDREQTCCKHHGTFGYQVELEEHLDIRHMFHIKLTCKERQNYLTAVCFTKFHQEPQRMIAEGYSLCWNGVLYLLGVSTGCLSSAHNRMIWGINAVEHIPRKIKSSPVTTMLSGWIDYFVWRWTEKMPHKTFLHLPASFTKTMIYHQCAEQCKYVNSKSVWVSPCCRMFLMVWTQNFDHVRIPRLNHFSKCNFCARWALMRQNRRLSDLQELALDKEKAGERSVCASPLIPDWDEVLCGAQCVMSCVVFHLTASVVTLHPIHVIPVWDESLVTSRLPIKHYPNKGHVMQHKHDHKSAHAIQPLLDSIPDWDELVLPCTESSSAEHDRLWQCQKNKYEWHKKKSRKSFGEGLGRWMSVIIDGMDQDKSNLPRCYSQSKDLKALEPLDISIIGVIVHGFEQRCYVVKPNWKHDTNLTIHILVLTLIRVAEKGPLPRVLYLQMDNCWRENKNQYMFTFLALLVKLGIFKKVKVNFDLVGHTHEDVDQMFQVLNSILKRETVATIEKLIELVSHGMKSNKHGMPYSCDTIEAVGLWKEWFAPLNPTFHNHTFPHCFKVHLLQLLTCHTFCLNTLFCVGFFA